VNTPYHREILERALVSRVSAQGLAVMYRANVNQDRLTALLNHPEFHFDNNAIVEGLAYIERCRAEAASTEALSDEALSTGKPIAAWAAFGRLTHGAQDFYAHTNYVTLWREQFPSLPPVRQIDGIDPALLKHPRLFTCHTYLPLEAFYYIPGLASFIQKRLPADSHANMNLDAPATGEMFPYAMEAAVQRTVIEFERTLALIGEEHGEAAMQAFVGAA
jgi:hypothetical protein